MQITCPNEKHNTERWNFAKQGVACCAHFESGVISQGEVHPPRNKNCSEAHLGGMVNQVLYSQWSGPDLVTRLIQWFAHLGSQRGRQGVLQTNKSQNFKSRSLYREIESPSAGLLAHMSFDLRALSEL